MLGPFKYKKLIFYRFAIFAPYSQLNHGIFTRTGGLSFPPKNDLNLAFGSGDAPATVLANRRLAEGALKMAPSIFVQQTHSDRVFFVETEDNYKPVWGSDAAYGYDALASASANLPLLLKLADCQGVILFEPQKNILALVHSGWRGSVQNIIGKTVLALKDHYGLEPKNLLAAISPSLGPCCAEFKNYQEELPQDFWPYKDDSNHFDFWAISQSQLQAAGLLAENIEVAGICTKCCPEFFSYRRGDKYGRFGILAGLSF